MRFVWNDALLVISFMLNLGARALTIIVTSTIGAYTATANVLESNPSHALLLTSSLISFGLLGIEYAFFTAFYIYMRRHRGESDKGEFMFLLFTLLIFFVFMMDFANNFFAYLGITINR